MLTVCKHLLFDALRTDTYDSVCLKGFGMEQVITQLAVKSCLMIILVFMRLGGQLFYQRSRNYNRYCI